MIKLPRFKCTEEIMASKITMVPPIAHTSPDTPCTVMTESGPVEVTVGWVAQHNPTIGGYVVIYDGRHLVCRRARLIEGNYTPMT